MSPDRLTVRSPDGALAELHRRGAHITSWVPAGGEERLFLSAASEFRDGTAIRGGVPVIFPQFAAEGPLPRHGFARTAEWASAAVGPGSRAAASATFRLTDSPATRAIWPHEFVADLTVAVGGASLRIELAVLNAGHQSFTFSGALHTYLRVDDVRRTFVHGLYGIAYRDPSAPGGTRIDDAPELGIEGEIDRVYLGAPSRLEVREPHRSLLVESTGFPDAVIWNPGAERAAALADLEPGGWQRMLCVEAAVVGVPVRLAPGERWTGSQTLIAR